jgi:hypothetical protein
MSACRAYEGLAFALGYRHAPDAMHVVAALSGATSGESAMLNGTIDTMPALRAVLQAGARPVSQPLAPTGQSRSQ